MFIQTEATANMDVMRFLPGRTVLEDGTANFRDAEAAQRSPLAERLFQIEAVIGVCLDADAIVVSKQSDVEWQYVKPAILGVIMEHFTAGKPVLLDAPTAGAPEDPEHLAEITAQIQDLIDTRIRPAVTQSGGDIFMHGYERGVVRLSSDAPALIAGMRMGIENILQHYVPEVTDVRFVEHRPSAADNIRDEKPGLNSTEAAAIYDVLDEQVNPAVASHGGHISLVDVQGDTAYIRLEGGCQGCGLADVTLKQGVETAIRQAVPSIAAVLDTTDHAGGTNPYFQPGGK
jgi:Fe-S cluster biogenesis protein NfuA